MVVVGDVREGVRRLDLERHAHKARGVKTAIISSYIGSEDEMGRRSENTF